MTKLLLSPDAQTLVTVGEDKSVFFLSISHDAAVPIGFVELSSVINFVSWSEDSTRLLVSCQDGSLSEYLAPKVR